MPAGDHPGNHTWHMHKLGMHLPCVDAADTLHARFTGWVWGGG